jgi:hypothetical protein
LFSRYGFLIPAVIILALRKDNAYWQGVVEKGMYMSFTNYGAMTRSASEADIRRPLLDTHFDPLTAGTFVRVRARVWVWVTG